MSDFLWSKWLEKWGKGLAAVFIGSGALYTAEFIQVNPLPPEYAFWSGLLIVLLLQIGNAVKHTVLA